MEVVLLRVNESKVGRILERVLWRVVSVCRIYLVGENYGESNYLERL